MSLLIFHELHVDDELLLRRRDRATFQASRTLIEQLLTAAEQAGHKLALRVRHPFAEAARAFEGADTCLRRWEQRGHEIGAHAHSRRVTQTVQALRLAGVQDLRGIVPGLMRSSRRRARRTLAACEGLGLRYVSDQLQFRAFPWAGLTPWRPAADLSGPGEGPWVFMDVSVNPFAWGLLHEEEDGRVGQAIGLRDEHFRRLEVLLQQQLALPRPHPVCYFGVPFHEHQHGRSWEDLAPDARSLQAWADYLARPLVRAQQSALPRDIYARWVAMEGEPPAQPARRLDRLDPRGRRHDVRSWVMDKLPEAPRLPPRPPRPRRRPAGDWRALSVDGRPIRVLRLGPTDATAALVCCHAGLQGGTEQLLRPLGLEPADLPGWALWFWDRSGTGGSPSPVSLEPGQPEHAAEAAAVFALAQGEGLPTGWLTWSAGILPALLSGAAPEFLVDAEAPSDRCCMAHSPGRVLTPEQAERQHLGWLGDPGWEGREPVRLLPALTAPYHRLQAEVDHRQGRTDLHARMLLDAAGGPVSYNGQPWPGGGALPGHLPQNGPAIAAILQGLRQDLLVVGRSDIPSARD